jgi:hypothetical protein
MKQMIEKQRNPRRQVRHPIMIVGWLLVFSGLTLCTAQAAPISDPTTWMGAGGAVLLQHTGSGSSMGLQAFKENAAAAQWTNIPENAGEWSAVAMDENRVLFFYEKSSEMALCTLDETGTPIDWLPLKSSFRKFVPVALEGNCILMQRGSRGTLKKIQFDETGRIVSDKRIWENSRNWAVRGMDSNRMVLEHLRTGDVIIWATNPKGPLFRPYSSFTLDPGWTVRDFKGDFVLIQQGDTGPVKLVELGDGYQAQEYSELISANEGWRAVAMAR